MATDIRFIHAREFIKATPEGQLDLEKSRELLLQIASASPSLDDYEILLDMRRAQAEMSVTDLWYLAAELSKLLRSRFSRKIAVLTPLERFDDAKFFALAAENRGFSVRAFTSFEDAFEWLIANDKEASRGG